MCTLEATELTLPSSFGVGNRIRLAIALYRTFGFEAGLRRLVHEIRSRFGWYRLHPRVTVNGVAGNPLSVLVIDTDRLRAAVPEAVARQRGQRVLDGRYQAFRWDWRPYPRAIEWSVHPVTRQTFPTDVPWWQVPLLSRALGDVKDVWEPARFAWVYDLVRAHIVTGDPKCAECFAMRVREWMEANPPFIGVQWGCGQETAVRAIALLWGESNLVEPGSATQRSLIQVLGWSGERIADAIGYAASQRNNHLISEAAGLIALGARLSGVHPDSSAWLRTGKKFLDKAITTQFAPDGWYTQHSVMYHRLALDQCVIASRVLRSVGVHVSNEARHRLETAHKLLCALVRPETGVAPNYGPNDGSMVLPIASAALRDVRPTITAVSAEYGFPVPLDIEPDRETLAWLGCDSVPRAPAGQDGYQVGVSGWAIVRTGAVRVFLRGGCYRSRPGHIDPLHIDVSVGDTEVVMDPGTFAYNAEPPWNNTLADAECHNGPLVGARAAATRGPRFMWLTWPHASIEAIDEHEGVVNIRASRAGVVVRDVAVRPGRVTVEDRPQQSGDAVRVCWTMGVGAEIAAVTSSGGETVVVDPSLGSVIGWVSPSYGLRVPTRALVVSGPVGGTIRTEIRVP